MASPLTALLRRRIAVEGPLSVADFMAAALGHPEHGYYATRDPFGVDGDFITAPEVSQMFGELIGLWCAQCWQDMGRPAQVTLAELGPGRGTLMADAVRAAAMLPAFRAALSVHLVETSPVLRRRQAETLGDLAVTWHTDTADLPDGPTLIVANEFFDALPVRQLVRQDTGWHERLVTWDPDRYGFRFVLAPAPSPASALLAEGQRSAPVGAIAEVSPTRTLLADRLGRQVSRQGGAALVVDYGHVTAAAGDTLQAVLQHGPVDPLDEPGEADLTAHVDFEALGKAAADAGARLHGPVPQGTFLGRLGIGVRAERLKAANPGSAATIDAAHERLTDPGQMGGLFKVLCIADPALPVQAGFET